MYYKIYDEIIKSDITISLLSPLEIQENDDFIDLNIQFCDNDFIFTGYIEKNNDHYDIVLSKNIKYQIYIDKKKINCYCKNYNEFESTFFNIPMSIYYTLRGKILFHACTMINKKNNLFIFAGRKGIGKSTLTTVLENDELLLYSDDTILIDKNLKAYRAHNYIKYTNETIKNVKNIILIKKENITKKQYGLIISPINNNVIIKKLFYIFRSDNFSLNLISNDILKNIYFLSNIVGIKCFDNYLISIIKNFLLNINCYKLCIPNNFKKLMNQKKFIVSKLCEE